MKIAQVLARAGLHMAATTVCRKLKEPPKPRPVDPVDEVGSKEEKVRVVTAREPLHVLHIDMTQIPITGLWIPWLPFALPQVWPFVWHVVALVDHYSRACLGFAVFVKEPSADQVTAFVDGVITKYRKPKYIVSDQGPQFRERYKAWAKGHGIKLRFGKIGEHGSIAVIERFFHTVKSELMRVICVPLNLNEFRNELALYVTWYNQYRPHTTLGGKTPMEVFQGLAPANEQPRHELRACYPRGSPCAAPQASAKDENAATPALQIAFLEGRKHLPIVTLEAA